MAKSQVEVVDDKPKIDDKLFEAIKEKQNQEKAKNKVANYDLKTVSRQEAATINQIKEDPREALRKSTEFIAENFNTVMKVAAELYRVHKYQLFRLDYNSFKDYVNMEFEYTRGRAYQLTSAHEVAEYINTSIKQDEPILTTEPQCRELLKVKKYKDEEHQILDEEQSNKERLKLVKSILKNNDKKISTQLIVESVRDWLNKENDYSNLPPVTRYDNSINKSCDNIYKMMKNISNTNNLTDKDFNLIKDNMKAKLLNTIETIDKMALASNDD